MYETAKICNCFVNFKIYTYFSDEDYNHDEVSLISIFIRPKIPLSDKITSYIKEWIDGISLDSFCLVIRITKDRCFQGKGNSSKFTIVFKFEWIFSIALMGNCFIYVLRIS